MKQKTRQILFFLAGLVISIGFDQWTKALAVAKLKGQEAFVIWEGVFELRYLENRGAAFGMLQGRMGFFFLIAVVVIVAVGYLLWRMPATKRFLPMTVCLFLIVSGAVGNMIDRIMQGYVVDFLYFSLIDFPIFNVADCYVTVAAFLLAALFLFYYKDEELSFLSWKKEEV